MSFWAMLAAGWNRHRSLPIKVTTVVADEGRVIGAEAGWEQGPGGRTEGQAAKYSASTGGKDAAC